MKNSFSKLHLLYYILAVFDLVIICAALGLSRVHSTQYSKVVESNSQSLSLLDLAGQLLVAASRVNAPGNDLFQSRDLVDEERRYKRAIADFQETIVQLKELLNAKSSVGNSFGNSVGKKEETLAVITEIERCMSSMQTETAQVFSMFRARRIGDAGTQMAKMDRSYADLVKAIESFRKAEMQHQVQVLAQHETELSSFRIYEIGLTVFALVLLGCFGVYGLRISRFAGQNHVRDEYFSRIVENSADAIVSSNSLGKINSWNRGAERIFGYSAQEVIGQSFSILLPKEKLAVIDEWFTPTNAPLSFLRQELVLVKKDRSEVLVSMTMSSVRNDEMAPIGWSFIIRDMTDVRNNELVEKRLRAQLEEAQKVAKIGSWSYDVETGKISWSKQMYEIFPEDINGGEPSFEKHMSTIHVEDLPLWKAAVEKCLRDGEPYSIRFRTIFPDKVIWVEALGRGRMGDSGKVKSLFGTCQDITERVQSEEENRFILDALKIGVWKFVPPTQSLEWDPSMYSVFEIDPADFSGHYNAWESSLSPKAKEEAVRELELALKGEKEFNTTFEIETKNGRKKHIGGRGVVLRDSSGNPILMYGINWDRTEEVKLEQELQLERAKSLQAAKLASLGEMSAGIAHEINNPLAIISANIPLLSKFADDPAKLKAKIETVGKSVERIAKIVNGLRKFSRSKNHAEFADKSLADLVSESLILTEAKAKRHSVKINYECQTRASINCDELEIEQVIVILINNGIDAVKELPDRWLKIILQEENDQLVLRVIDSGTGISPALEQKIFQPFFTTKPVGDGTGLGLSIAKGILDQHKASIALNRSFPNTCFELRFRKKAVDRYVA